MQQSTQNLILLLILILASPSARPSTASVLPPPDGPHAVGTTVWHMIDASRDDPLTEPKWDHREVMVQAWYPTSDASLLRAPYSPDATGSALTHAIPGAGIEPALNGLPVVMIAPGRGTPRYSYTALAESLASHGYAAITVDSPHSGSVYFPDGRTVHTSLQYRPGPGLFNGPYAKVDAFFEPAAQAGGRDLVFVLNEFAKLNTNDPAGRFTGRLDLERVGVFGHSLGGRIAGAAVAMDHRFKAFMAMEGVAPRKARRGGLDAATAILLTANVYPFAIDNVREFVPHRHNDVFIVTLETFGHNSVTDRPLIEGGFDYKIDARKALTLTRDLARVFFARYLRDDAQSFDDIEQWPALVRIESYPAPRRTNEK